MNKDESQTTESTTDYLEWCTSDLEKIDEQYLKEVWHIISFYEKRSTKKDEQKKNEEQEKWIAAINLHLEKLDSGALRKIHTFAREARKLKSKKEKSHERRGSTIINNR